MVLRQCLGNTLPYLTRPRHLHEGLHKLWSRPGVVVSLVDLEVVAKQHFFNFLMPLIPFHEVSHEVSSFMSREVAPEKEHSLLSLGKATVYPSTGDHHMS